MSVASSDETLSTTNSSESLYHRHRPESINKKRVKFVKALCKEFSSLEPSQALMDAPEFTINDFTSVARSTGSIASVEVGLETSALQTAPEFLIEASVGILAQAAASEIVDSLQRTQLSNIREGDVPLDQAMEALEEREEIDSDNENPAVFHGTEDDPVPNCDWGQLCMRIVMTIVLVALLSHLLQTVLSVIYYMIFPVVTIVICSVMYTKDGWSSNAGFEDSFWELKRLANSFWDGCRQLYEEARGLIV